MLRSHRWEEADVLHAASGGTAAHRREQRFDLARLPGRCHLDGAIVAIANPPRNAEALRDRARELPKADALHAARHLDVREHLTQRRCRSSAVSTAESAASSLGWDPEGTSSSPSRTRAAMRSSVSATSLPRGRDLRLRRCEHFRCCRLRRDRLVALRRCEIPRLRLLELLERRRAEWRHAAHPRRRNVRDHRRRLRHGLGIVLGLGL